MVPSHAPLQTPVDAAIQPSCPCTAALPFAAPPPTRANFLASDTSSFSQSPRPRFHGRSSHRAAQTSSKSTSLTPEGPPSAPAAEAEQCPLWPAADRGHVEN